MTRLGGREQIGRRSGGGEWNGGDLSGEQAFWGKEMTYLENGRHGCDRRWGSQPLCRGDGLKGFGRIGIGQKGVVGT